MSQVKPSHHPVVRLTTSRTGEWTYDSRGEKKTTLHNNNFKSQYNTGSGTAKPDKSQLNVDLTNL